MAIVSIIVPVYNVEQYLEECLESILTQSYRDLEVICVNDGSTDGSAEILETFRCRDSRVIVITTENQGVSIARNTGLEVATGKYIYFVDSDDYLVPDAIESMVSVAEEHAVEIVAVDIEIFSNDMQHLGYAVQYERENFALSEHCPPQFRGIELIRIMIDAGYFRPVIYGFLYRREFLASHNINFVPNVIYEDVLFVYKVLIKAEHAASLHKKVYVRRIHAGSITTQASDFNSVYSYLQAVIGLKQYALNTAAYLEELSVSEPINSMRQNAVIRYLQLDPVEQQRILETSAETQFMFATEIQPVIDAEKKALNYLDAIKQYQTDVATLEAALNQREKDVATLENALNQRAAEVATLENALNQRAAEVATLENALNQRVTEVAALESRLKAIEETWLYKAASRIIKG